MVTPGIIAWSVLIGVCFLAGLQHLYIGLRKREGLLHIYFGLLAFSVMFYAFFTMLYNKNAEIELYRLYTKTAVTFAIFAFLFLVLFTEEYLNVKNKKLKIFFGVFACINLLVLYYNHWGLHMDEPGSLIVITNIWGESFYSFQTNTKPGRFLILYDLYLLLAILYMLRTCYKGFKSEKRRQAKLLFFGYALILTGTVFDVLFMTNVYPIFTLSEFAFSIFIIVMSFELTNDVLRSALLKTEAIHLQETDRLKSRFFANISHEFRTPLTLILGPVKQMLSGEFTGNLKEQYQMIIRNGERLLHLINQLLDLSKLESGKLKLQAEHTEIVSYLRQLVQSFESLAMRKQIDLKFNTELEEQQVYLDRDKFEKIINNLLSNAFKFTPDGGDVKIALSLPGVNRPTDDVVISNRIASFHSSTRNDDNGFIQISISNTGPGIAAQDLDKIFDRFYQVNHAQNGNSNYAKDGAGSGIGLALCKELVEVHYGTIEVQSEAGKGAVFTVTLPLGRKHLSEEEIRIQNSEIRTQELISNYQLPIEKRTHQSSLSFDYAHDDEAEAIPPPDSGLLFPIILIVEDNADMRQFIINSLDGAYRILEAEDGDEGFTTAMEEIPDLIISDVMMPKMDGLEFCAKIKSDQRTSHIPLILMTARAAQEDKIEGLETGADDYLTKPFDKDELNVRVKNLINLRLRLREKFKKDFSFTKGNIPLNSLDETFIKKICALIEKNIADPHLSAETLQSEMALGERQLYRKIVAITGQTPGQFIRIFRLRRAKDLLEHHTDNVSQIAFEVGFNNLSYFSKCFKEAFGILPKEVKD